MGIGSKLSSAIHRTFSRSHRQENQPSSSSTDPQPSSSQSASSPINRPGAIRRTLSVALGPRGQSNSASATATPATSPPNASPGNNVGHRRVQSEMPLRMPSASEAQPQPERSVRPPEEAAPTTPAPLAGQQQQQSHGDAQRQSERSVSPHLEAPHEPNVPAITQGPYGHARVDSDTLPLDDPAHQSNLALRSRPGGDNLPVGVAPAAAPSDGPLEAASSGRMVYRDSDGEEFAFPMPPRDMGRGRGSRGGRGGRGG